MSFFVNDAALAPRLLRFYICRKVETATPGPKLLGRPADPRMDPELSIESSMRHGDLA